jgi:P27 family predicted phage terminase small subunit
MRGRKPKPTELHKRHGTIHATKHKAQLAAEPIPVTEIGLSAPDWMTESQKAGWRYIIENAPPGLLKACDFGTLVTFVEAEDRHRNAIVALAKQDENSTHPMVVETKSGNLIQSPYVGIINRAAMLMIRAASELGFSPAARPRLAVATGMVMDAPALGAPAPPSDNLDSFLARRPEALDS